MRFAVVSSLLAACMCLWVPPAQAFCRLTTANPQPGTECNGDGEPLMWTRQCISYSTTSRSDTSLSEAEAEAIIDTSFRTWEQVQCQAGPLGLQLRPTAEHSRCARAEHNPEGSNVNSLIFIDDWAERELPAEAFGLTLVWHNPETGHIRDADMLINETMGQITQCGEVCESRTVVDLQNVITHEAGHFLGLGHSFSRTSSMFFEARTGETRKRFLNDDDTMGVCAIYPDLPEPACEAEDFEPRGGFSPVCADVDSCSVSEPGRDRRGGKPLALGLTMLAAIAARRRSSRAA